MNQVEWHADIEDKTGVTAKNGTVVGDKFQALIKAKDDSRAAAKISVLWGESGAFSSPKVSVMVTVTCDQNEGAMNEAAFQAYEMAKRVTAEIIEDYNGRAE